jgi:tRNA A37 threonylcarbamoyladenosine dehydratase
MSWYERTELLLGKENLEKLRNSKVLVCGLGGVGGAAAEQLVRAGVGNICIVDADVVSETNINRQIIATHKNIGNPKTQAFRERLLAINPDLKLSEKNVYLKDELLVDTLKMDWDFVVDAIDTFSPKLNLIRICHQNKIPFVSSMGAGGKIDPQAIKIADISKSFNCGLARMLRKKLHRIGIFEGITVVFSEEKADKDAIVEEESENKKSNCGTISYMPVIFGCMCASVVIRRLIEK